MSTSPSSALPRDLYEIHATAIDGRDVPLDEFHGQVLLIVNVASQCGFTPQYQGLEELYQHYRERGFAVLGFPCNQFGQQEPGGEAEIQEFCSTKFHVTFPMFAKVEVNGANTHPLYRFLKSAKPGVLGTERIKWNFTKFLIDRAGTVVKRYPSTTKPERLQRDIEALLDQPAT